MPPMLVPQIPVYSTSPSSSGKSTGRSVTPARPTFKGRMYGDGPLPAKPSNDAPADARIIGRVIDHHGVYYHLKIGGVDINDVTVQEVLEYVSPEHLEAYENAQFVQEAELERVAKEHDERMKAERRARAAEQARMRGVVGFRTSGDDDSDSSSGEMATGKHGRKRPTYTHLYEKARERRRRRKRDPRTGELMPLSDEDERGGAAPVESSEDDISAIPSQQLGSSMQQFKRRRRKRDPVTGELMPLPPDKSVSQHASGHEKKRRRRKRHPRTGELMPYGWVYDPDAPEENKGTSSRRSGVNAMSPAMNLLSISREHQTKRLKLDSQSASGSSMAQVVLQKMERASSDEEEESSDESDNGPPPQQGPSTMKSPLKPASGVSRGQLGVRAALQSAATSSAPESTPEPNTMTSILQPTAGTIDLEDEESDEVGDGEWVIEGILAHHMSDPRTHAPELGKKAVMLYQVKWEGFDELTWEPMESFPDRTVVDDYMRRVARHGASHSNKQPHKQTSRQDSESIAKGSALRPGASVNKAQQLTTPSKQGSGDSEEDDEDDADDGQEEGVYEIESITGHHLSDPRTHPAELGKEPVMLYKVKWKGYLDYTWEPIDSFDDLGDLNRYRGKVGLPLIDDEVMDV